MSDGAVIEAVVTEQGLVVSAAELDKVGVHPGDHVLVSTRRTVAPRRMVGIAASASGARFTNQDLREIRREMAHGLGEDIER